MKLSCSFRHSRLRGDDDRAVFYFSFVINKLCLCPQIWLSFIHDLVKT